MYLLFWRTIFYYMVKDIWVVPIPPTGNSQYTSWVIALSNMYAFCQHITLKVPKKGSTALMATIGEGKARQRRPPFRSCFPCNSHWIGAVPPYGGWPGEVTPHAPLLKSILTGGLSWEPSAANTSWMGACERQVCGEDLKGLESSWVGCPHRLQDMGGLGSAGPQD